MKGFAEELLGKTLVTHQTGPEGREIKRLLIEEGCDIQKEYYVGLVLDRATSRIVLMASEEGGTEIEEVAEKRQKKSSKWSSILQLVCKAIRREKWHLKLIFQQN